MNATLKHEDFEIIPDANERPKWLHYCEGEFLVHLPLTMRHCSCGATLPKFRIVSYESEKDVSLNLI